MKLGACSVVVKSRVVVEAGLICPRARKADSHMEGAVAKMRMLAASPQVPAWGCRW